MIASAAESPAPTIIIGSELGVTAPASIPISSSLNQTTNIRFYFLVIKKASFFSKMLKTFMFIQL